MTLFFYGAIAVRDDYAESKRILDTIINGFGWQVFYHKSQSEIHEALKLSEEKNYLVFECPYAKYDAYEILYDDYSGEIMVSYYRQIARHLSIQDWEELEFASHNLVTETYSQMPYPELPITGFLGKVFDGFSARDIVIAIDHEFENRFNCDDIAGDSKKLLIAAWQTIAFGYSWPNIRLLHIPTEKKD